MTLRQTLVTLTLLDDVVLSRRNATTGDHESLNHIPGSALYGCVAARLYGSLKASGQAWTVFHSGQVRFGDALPLARDGQRALPMPLSWHTNKADPPGPPFDNGWWQGEHIVNRADSSLSEQGATTWRALREGYVTAAGHYLQPLRQRRMMTAIDDDGVAASGQLYGYQSLREGQQFQSLLLFEPDVGHDLMQAVRQTLDGTSLRIGRSKASHYGRVHARVGETTDWTAQVDADPDPCRLTLWLLSDASLRDPWGQPTLNPQAEVLGLPGATLNKAHSFLRSRRYSPWNAYRAMPELERQVLTAGGVIALQRPGQPFTADELMRLQCDGIGCGRVLGLGAVAVNPSLLRGVHPQRLAATAQQSQGQLSTSNTDTPSPTAALDPSARRWLAIVQGRAKRGNHADTADKWVAEQLMALRLRWTAIRSYQGWRDDRAHGPAATQWGNIGWRLDRVENWADVHESLLAAHGVAPPEDADWDGSECRAPNASPARASAEPAATTGSLRDWLSQVVRQAQAQWRDDPVAGFDALKRLAQQVRRKEMWLSQAHLTPQPQPAGSATQQQARKEADQ